MDKKLVAAWIRYHQQSKPRDNDPDFEACEKLDGFIHNQPSHALNLVEQIISQTNDKNVLSNVGAGPLEDLLVHHGEQFVDNVLDNARRDANWRFALGCVWIDSANTPEVKKKVKDAIMLYFPEGTP